MAVLPFKPFIKKMRERFKKMFSKKIVKIVEQMFK